MKNMLGLWSRYFLLYLLVASFCVAAKFTYMINERPRVTFVDHKYIGYANFKSHRFSRSDPFYYVSINASVLYSFGNNVTVSFSLYELLSNQYKPSFVEMRFKLCDLIESDMFGINFRQGKFLQPCPFPAGEYAMSNMTVKRVPSNFPFRKGRVYIKLTVTATRELIAAVQIDLEVKETTYRPRR